MLLACNHNIEKVLVSEFTLDTGEVKKTRLHEGDFATVTWSNASLRKQITGKITRIEAGTHLIHDSYHNHICQHQLTDTCDKNYWFIIVDGSTYGDSNMQKIEVTKILDIEVIKRNESVLAVTSPLGSSNITDIRVNGNLFQVSFDNQKTWNTVARMPETDIVVDPELQPVVDKIAATIPAYLSPAEKEKMVMEILQTMKDTGQIVINKNECNCGCNQPTDPEEPDTPPVDSDTTATVDDVIKALREQGLIHDPCECKPEETKAAAVNEMIEELKRLGIIPNDTTVTTPPESGDNNDGTTTTDPGTTETEGDSAGEDGSV